MTDAKSPSNDPDFLHLPPGVGIRHYSGVATDLLDQLAPLLAAEGIDVDHLQEADPEQLKAAMMRAVERHNLELSTPIGDQRARAVNTLRELVIAHHAEDSAQIQLLFGSIGPVPTRHRPSSGHLTGVTMEALDTIYRNEQLHPALHIVEIPRVESRTKAAAQHILGLAAKGRAFRSLDTVLIRHGGFEVSRAGVLLLTATCEAIAKHRNTAFDPVVDELLPVYDEDDPSGDILPGLHATPQEYLADFEAWLKSQPEVADIAVKIVTIFTGMVEDAQDMGLNPYDPADFDDWVAVVHERTDPKYLVTALEIIKYYLQFRLRTSIEPEQWHHAHAQITDLTLPHEGSPWDFEKIFDATQQIEWRRRYSAMLELSIVSGSRYMFQWLATPRGVTEAGAPLLDDIGLVGEMIGLNVRGVRQPDSPPVTGHVQSTLEVPELMVWWWTLQELGIITVMGARVELGSAADDFFGSEHIPFEGVEGLVATYVKTFLIHSLEHAPLEISSVGHTIARLLNALEGLPAMQPPGEDDFRAQLVQHRSDEYLQSLASLGLIGLHQGEPYVPPPLAAAIFYGLMMAMDYLDEFLDVYLS